MRGNIMLRASLFAIFGLCLVTPAAPVRADWNSFWQRAHLDFHRNNCWPVPFQKADRETVCRAMSIQIANGWQQQNTLTDVYFDAETQFLNEAGRRKLWAILKTSPEQYRTVYVVESMNPDAETRRLDSIQVASNEMFKDQPLPEIVSVQIAPRAWSADYIETISRKVNSTIPNPRLPEFTDTTSGN
jgi:hypothetical protein